MHCDCESGWMDEGKHGCGIRMNGWRDEEQMKKTHGWADDWKREADTETETEQTGALCTLLTRHITQLTPNRAPPQRGAYTHCVFCV